VSTLDDLLNADVVVTHPASFSRRDRASREPGSAAKVAEASKRSTHDHCPGAVLIVLYGITTTANNVFTSITTSENQFIVEAFCTYLHLAMRAMAC
jgi:hypothetical protein